MLDIITGVADLTAALFIGVCVWGNRMSRGGDRRSGVLYFVMLLLLFVMLASQGISYFLVGSGFSDIRMVLDDLSSAGYYALLGTFSYFLWTVCSKQTTVHRIWYMINVILSVGGFVYWLYLEHSGLVVVGADGKVSSSIYYLVGQLFGYLEVAILIMMLIAYSNYLKPRQLVLYLTYFAIPIIVSVLRSFLGGPNLLYLAMAICLFVLYQLEHIDVQREYLIQQNKLTESELAMMIQQVQPHFMYNVFNTIYHLSVKDPVASQEAIGQFSDFFRANLAAITTQEPIPFDEELENTKMYIYLEKLRFEENLEIEYDIACEEFSLPPLSIRPLVGNCIKHNINKTGHPLHVKVATREYEDRFEVTVEDDGVGYRMGRIPDDGRKHVGLANLRRRLELISGGSLEISGKSGGGTLAVIKIPKGK